MGRTKAAPTSSDRDLIVVYWDGFGREHQAAEQKDSETPLQWEFTQEEAETQCQRQIKKGALRAEVWRPGKTPEKVAAFERTRSGACQRTYPRRFS